MEARAAAQDAGVAERGILEPLLVRPNPEAEGRFLIVFGEGRWIAAKAAKLATVPALIRTDMTDADVTASQAAESECATTCAPGRSVANAVDKLLGQGHEIQQRHAAIVGVTSETGEMQRLQKLGKLSQAARCREGNTFPDDNALSTIALAPTEVQGEGRGRAASGLMG